MGTYNYIKVEVKDFIATMTLERPPVNALDMGALKEIAAVFQEVGKRDDVRVAIFTATGKCFCAGRDIRAASAESPEERMAAVKAMFSSVYHCEVPVIAAVNGAAMGAGFTIASLCDFIIGADTANFAKPEIDAGVNPGTAINHRGFNEYQTRRMCFLGERFSSQEMYRLGMLYSVVPLAELMPAAQKLAQVLAAKSPMIMRQVKKSANEVEGIPDFEQAMERELQVTVQLSKTADSKEAGRSLLEKRAPDFKSK
ncbi:MAG: enoyl-CoA hydratase-related protein [Dehalococcoidales bacterium]|nr:enoyl-CoA hydratase-related protein [Dehalococcoidales bacterium]